MGLLAFAGCVESDAQVDARATVEERARAISRILSDFAFDSRIVKEENAATCEAVTNALRDRVGITFVEPVLISDDPEHPRLAAYRDRCRNFDNWPPGVANSEYAYRTLADVGDLHFELFELDRRSGERSPNELLYADATPERQAFEVRGGFVAVDLNRCVIEAGVPRPQSDVGVTTLPAASVVEVNALTLFDNQYYVITVHDVLYQARTEADQQPIYSLTIWRLPANGPFDAICSSQTPVDPD